MIHILASPADTEARQYTACAARCAQHGWILRQCADGYELLGNGARATWAHIEYCAEWLDKQDKTKDIDDVVESVQLSFLEVAA